MRILIASLVVIGLVSFYFIGWKLNRKQKLPDDMKDLVKNCDACGHTGCGSHPEQRGEEDE